MGFLDGNETCFLGAPEDEINLLRSLTIGDDDNTGVGLLCGDLCNTRLDLLEILFHR